MTRLSLVAVAGGLCLENAIINVTGKRLLEPIATSSNSGRRLEETSSSTNTTKIFKDEWKDCLGMTAVQCKQHILDSVDGDLSNHAVPNLKLIVSPERTPLSVLKSYWEIGIPTTVTGEVDCSINEGFVRFPYDWETLEGTYTLPTWNCNGLNAIDCCMKVIQDMEDRVIPLVDVHGNCFSCRTHQEPMEPHIDHTNGSVHFIEHTYDDSTSTCTTKEYTPSEVQEVDSQVATSLVGIRAQIESILQTSTVIYCKDYVKLHHTLLTHARSLPHLMSATVGMLCGVCDMLHYSSTDVLGYPDGILTQDARDNLLWIHNQLAAAIIRSDKSEIIIYTDKHLAEVLVTPVVGGSRTGVYEDVVVTGEDITNDRSLNITECPAATIDDLEPYWEGTALNQDTSDESTCSCPKEHNLLELNHKCYCQGGYKLWDPITKTCQCPHGTKEDSHKCICPGPFSGLDWNNVGWIDNDQGSCRLDYDCSLSGLDYYDNFETGCNTCQPGYELIDGICSLNCDQTKGLVYSRHYDECICIHMPEMEFIPHLDKCDCKWDSMVWVEVNEKCECPEGMETKHTYKGYEIEYYCDYPTTDGDGYYKYGNYV